MWIYLSLLAAIVGLLLYGFAANPKLQDIGKMTYFAGILAFLLLVGSHGIALLR